MSTASFCCFFLKLLIFFKIWCKLPILYMLFSIFRSFAFKSSKSSSSASLCDNSEAFIFPLRFKIFLILFNFIPSKILSKIFFLCLFSYFSSSLSSFLVWLTSSRLSAFLITSHSPIASFVSFCSSYASLYCFSREKIFCAPSSSLTISSHKFFISSGSAITASW